MGVSLGLCWRDGVVARVLGCVGLSVSLAVLVGGGSAGAAVCGNEAFRTGASAALPDCRAYEMVSPADKNGGEVDGGVEKGAMIPPEQAAGSGEAVTYPSTSAFVGADPASAVVSSQYLSRRTSTGWSTRAIVPAQQLPKGEVQLLGEGPPDFSLFQGFSENLDYGFLLAWNPQPDSSAPAGYFNPYLFEDGEAPGYEVLSSVTPPSWPAGEADLSYEGFGAVYGGMSADGRHVIFEANDALTPEAIPGRVNLYEWNAGGEPEPLELVSVLPEGTVDPSGAKYPIHNGIAMSFGAFGVAQAEWPMPNLQGAVSQDGRRAFWNGGSATNYQLYMHEITGEEPKTVEVSASQNPGVVSGSARATFEAANPSGSLVYFTSGAKLTEGSTAGGNGKEDLYQYDTETGVLTDMTVDANAGESAGVLGFLGMGESAGVPLVYFAASGVLAPGAKAGADNLYVWRGDSDSIAYIATLGGGRGETLDFESQLRRRTSRVSPDGQLLAFQSAVPLTGYDNRLASGQPCPEPVREGNEYYYLPEASFEGRCMEVFEYDAQSGKLACASCDPAGLPPTADSLVPETRHLLGNTVGWQSSTQQQRYLLDDGRLFFQSEDPLLPAATDGRQNIYEYEPEGVGQCAADGTGSCLYLISTGTASADSYFVDAGETGRDVFFTTNQQLVPADGDEATDIYDAREGGGFATATPPPCVGEACKPALTAAPAIYGAPASATFQGIAGPVTQPGTASKPRKSTAKRKAKKDGAKKRERGKRRVRRRGHDKPHRRGFGKPITGSSKSKAGSRRGS